MSAKQSSAVDRALELVKAGMSRYKAAKTLGISQSTCYRAVKRHGIIIPKREKLEKLE